jgi:hypothetical protein
MGLVGASAAGRGFDGEVGGGAVVDFFFVIFDSGSTLELCHQLDPRGPALRLPADVDIFFLAELLFADSGADGGFDVERPQRGTGSSTTIGKSAALIVGVSIMFSVVTRAHEAAAIPTRSDAGQLAPAGSAALRLLADVDEACDSRRRLFVL